MPRSSPRRSFSFTSLWRRWFAPRPARPYRRRSAVRIEALEDRCVPATLLVNSLADDTIAKDGLVTLREAILAANHDLTTDLGETGDGADVIVFDHSLQGRISLASALPDLEGELTIQGPGAKAPIVRGSFSKDLTTFFRVASGAIVDLSRLTLSSGRGADGGALFNSGTLSLRETEFLNNTASRGGAIFNLGTLSIARSTFADNSADSSGGAIHNEGTLMIDGSTFDHNVAPSGGAIASTGTLLITSSSFVNGMAIDGGAIENRGEAVIESSSFSGNFSEAHGGAIANEGMLTLHDSVVNNNVSETGGAIYNAGALAIHDSSLAGNDGVYGGALFNAGVLTITGSELRNNIADQGGGIASIGELTIHDSVLFANQAGRGVLIIPDAPDEDQTDTGAGTAQVEGVVTAEADTDEGTAQAEADADGGTAQAEGQVTEEADTDGGTASAPDLTGDQSDTGEPAPGDSDPVANPFHSGGGIASSGSLVLINSTLSGNTALGSGGGLAVTGGLANLVHVTITANRSDSDADQDGRGGGLANLGGAIILNNTLVAGNFRSTDLNPDDIFGSVASYSRFNLVGHGGGLDGISDGTNGNQVGSATEPIDARLAPLGDNGGRFLTHALLPDSPAIDAGGPLDTPPESDQRGLFRVVDQPDVPNAPGLSLIVPHISETRQVAYS